MCLQSNLENRLSGMNPLASMFRAFLNDASICVAKLAPNEPRTDFFWVYVMSANRDAFRNRFSRRLTMTRITHKHSDHVAQRLSKPLKKTPDQPVRSMTFDNGTEFAECHKVAERHRAGLSFARPGCPQQ
jgi:Uri superfamily endonuclease